MKHGRRPLSIVAALVVAAPAVTLALALGSSSLGQAAAGAATVKAARGKVTCTKLSGTITFKPALTLTGSSSDKKDVAKVKAKLAGCKASKGAAPTGKVATKIVTKKSSGDANSCTGLDSPRAISLSITWTRTPSVAPTKVSFSSDKVAANSANDEGFELPAPGGKASVKGSYAGSNKGRTSTATVYSNEDATQLAAACGTGLSSLKLTSGKASLK
jgi:hypothetical protein